MTNCYSPLYLSEWIIPGDYVEGNSVVDVRFPLLKDFVKVGGGGDLI